MASSISKTGRLHQASSSALRRPKGLGLVVALASLQGLIALGVFARLIMWGSDGSAASPPDPTLSSVFMNTGLFQTSLGPLTIGDVSLWVERAVLIGISLLVARFAWRMHAHR